MQQLCSYYFFTESFGVKLFITTLAVNLRKLVLLLNFFLTTFKKYYKTYEKQVNKNVNMGQYYIMVWQPVLHDINSCELSDFG